MASELFTLAVLAAEACRDSGLRPVYDHFLSEWWRKRGIRAKPLASRVDGSRLNIDFLRAIPTCAMEIEDLSCEAQHDWITPMSSLY